MYLKISNYPQIKGFKISQAPEKVKIAKPSNRLCPGAQATHTHYVFPSLLNPKQKPNSVRQELFSEGPGPSPIHNPTPSQHRAPSPFTPWCLPPLAALFQAHLRSQLSLAGEMAYLAPTRQLVQRGTATDQTARPVRPLPSSQGRAGWTAGSRPGCPQACALTTGVTRIPPKYLPPT